MLSNLLSMKGYIVRNIIALNLDMPGTLTLVCTLRVCTMLFVDKFDKGISVNTSIPSVCTLRRCLDYYGTELLSSIIETLDFDIRY